MSTNFPTGLDTFPAAPALHAQTLGGAHHSQLHADLGDAIAALEAKVGVTGSAVTSSLTYILNHLTSGQISDFATAVLAIAAAVGRQVIAGTGLSGGGTLAADRTINLANTAVTPGSYTNTNLTVDQQGRITLAASGSAGSTSPLTTKGDVFTFSSVDAALAVGTDGYALLADSSKTVGLAWGPVGRLDTAQTWAAQQVFLTGTAGQTPLVVRQTGGVAGTDEVQVWADGTNGWVKSGTNALILDSAGRVQSQKQFRFGASITDVAASSFYIDANTIRMGPGYLVSWQLSNGVPGAIDLTLGRAAAGTISLNDANAGNDPALAIQAKSSTTNLRDRVRLVTAAIDNTDATRKYRATLNAYDTVGRETARGWADGSNGRFAAAAPASAPTDAHLAASQVSFYLDESGSNLMARVLYADGTTFHTCTIPFVPGTGTPGGSSKYVQYNDGSGGFSGASGFQYDGSQITVTAAGVTAVGITVSGGGARAVVASDGTNSVQLANGGYSVDATAGSIHFLGTSGNTLEWQNVASSPGDAVNPAGWALVNVAGTPYKLALYT